MELKFEKVNVSKKEKVDRTYVRGQKATEALTAAKKRYYNKNKELILQKSKVA